MGTSKNNVARKTTGFKLPSGVGPKTNLSVGTVVHLGSIPRPYNARTAAGNLEILKNIIVLPVHLHVKAHLLSGYLKKTLKVKKSGFQFHYGEIFKALIGKLHRQLVHGNRAG